MTSNTSQRISRSKFRGTTLLLVMLLSATSLSVPQASAAFKAGAACAKVNAKTKIGGDSYVCTKNPTLKKAKLTWVWSGCLEVDALYRENKAKYDEISRASVAVLASIDAEIAKIKADAPADEAAAKVFDQKVADAKAKQINALAEAKIAADKAVAAGATTAAGKSYQSAVDQWTKAARSYELAAKNFERSATSLRGKIGEVANKEKSKAKVNSNVQSLKIGVTSTAQDRKNACQPGL